MRATPNPGRFLASCFMPGEWWAEARAAFDRVMTLGLKDWQRVAEMNKEFHIDIGPPMKIDGIETAFGDVELLVDGVPIPVESVTYAKA